MKIKIEFNDRTRFALETIKAADLEKAAQKVQAAACQSFQENAARDRRYRLGQIAGGLDRV